MDTFEYFKKILSYIHKKNIRRAIYHKVQKEFCVR